MKATAAANHQRWKEREVANEGDVRLPAFTLRLPWPPTANTNVRHARGVHYKTPEYRSFEEVVWLAFHASSAPKIRGTFSVWIKAVAPDRRRRDADNVIKPLLDSLQRAGAIEDDCLARLISIELVDGIQKGTVLVTVQQRNEGTRDEVRRVPA